MTELGRKDPGCLFIGTFITSLSDKAEEFIISTTLVELGVEDFGDLILGFTINFKWWG
jgi:hypothetical protein